MTEVLVINGYFFSFSEYLYYLWHFSANSNPFWGVATFWIEPPNLSNYAQFILGQKSLPFFFQRSWNHETLGWVENILTDSSLKRNLLLVGLMNKKYRNLILVLQRMSFYNFLHWFKYCPIGGELLSPMGMNEKL